MIILLGADLVAGEMTIPVLPGQGCGVRPLMPESGLGVAALAELRSGSWGQRWGDLGTTAWREGCVYTVNR